MSYNKTIEYLSKKGFTSIAQYHELCIMDNRFSTDPEIRFGKAFKGWVLYLGIDRNKYYNIDQCKIKAQEHIRTQSIPVSNTSMVSKVYDQLVEMDRKFPATDLFKSYYSEHSLRDIIPIKMPPKKR
jgi:hypothetical protein